MSKTNLTPYDVYARYVAVKCHFNQKKFDATKYQTTGNCSNHSFNNRQDRGQFDIIAKRIQKAELDAFLISNFAYDSNFWIGAENGFEVYKQWTSRNTNLKHTITEDINRIAGFIGKHDLTWEQLLFSETMMDFGIQKMISVETFCIFNNILNIFDEFDKNHANFIWESMSLPYRKYGHFYRDAMSKSELRNTILQSKTSENLARSIEKHK